MVDELFPSRWTWVKLEDIQAPNTRAIVSGPFGSNIGSRFFVSDGVPVIRGNNLTKDMTRFIDNGFVFVTEEKARELSGCVALPGDLVFTAAGSLGQVGLIPWSAKYPKYIISNKQMRVRLNRQVVDELFAFYWFSSPLMVKYIDQRNTGSSVPLINLSILRNLPLPLPPLAEQRSIACILGTLDDKIELNRQMNKTLEAITKAIYKSWFVDFDPVRARMDDRKAYGMNAETASLFPNSFDVSPLGKIPKGWKIGTIGDIADNPRRGVTPNDINQNTPYIGLEHMPRKSIALEEWGLAQEVSSNKFSFYEGEILFGKLRPYFHKVGVAVLDGVCSTDILVIVPKYSEWFGFVLSHVTSDEFVQYTDGTSTGTKMPRTNWSDMKAYKIILPHKNIIEHFNKIVQGMVEAIRDNILQSHTLISIRDALLPKLLSGEIRIKDAEKYAETVL